MKDVKVSPVLLLIALLAAATSARAADIIGIITLKGTPPAETDITPLMDNPDCAAMYSDKTPTTHFYVVGSERRIGRRGGFAEGRHRQIHRRQRAARRARPERLPLHAADSRHSDRPEARRQKFRQLHPQRPLHADRGRQSEEHNDVQMPGGADLTYTFPQAGDVPEIQMRRASVDVRVGERV